MMAQTARHSMKGYECDMEKGAALLSQGRHRQAMQHFRAMLVGHPDDPLTLYNCGIACYHLGEYANAEACYQTALRHLPDWIEAYHNLGLAYEAQNKLPDAIAVYQDILKRKPDYFPSAYHLSIVCRLAGENQKAVTAIQTAVRSKPDSAEALCTLGLLYREQNRFAEALVCLDQALCIDPDLASASYNKGIVLHQSGEFEKAVALYRKAMASDATFAPAKWLYHLSLPKIYDTPEEILTYRRRFREHLNDLIASTPLATDAQKTFALNGVRSTTNFYLQYQCRNDLELQRRYGRFVHRIMQCNYPGWTRPRKMPPLMPGGKIRVGYVSTFMYDHTVGNFLSGWLENHDQSEFEIHSYHVGRKVDHLTRQIRKASHSFHCFAGDMAAAARQMDRDNLHLLVYSDVGMAPITLQLAALRLAPIQCKGWGHPVTTGLPTIDYYLTSDLMEPEDADGHYSETLVRLPNLALCYRPPQLPTPPKTRTDLGLPNDRFIYLSTQSIFKYLPQHDDIYPSIAKAVPRACFVFLGNESAAATAKFKLRLAKAFSAFELDAEAYCFFSKRLNFKDFMSLNMVADVLLDSLEWSGGKTTLEALSCGLPVVTLPGRFMRGRHAYAMLKMMGLSDTIADDKAAYCAIAVQLARDPAFFSRVKAFVLQNRSRLFHDRRFITALESFYRTVISQY
jgi:predicted O-linked N-acetylglucosamine transferase (SPINDLY family)